MITVKEISRSKNGLRKMVVVLDSKKKTSRTFHLGRQGENWFYCYAPGAYKNFAYK